MTLLERLAVADVAPSVRTQALLLLKELYVKRADLGNGLRALNAAVEIAGAGEDRELLHVLLVDAVWQCASLGFHGLAARYCGAAKEWLRAVGSSAAMVGVFTAAEMQLKVFEGKGLDGMEALAKELRLIVGNEKQMLAKRDILLSERECRVKEAFLSYAESVQRMMAER